MNKRKLISRYAVFLLEIVIMSEPVLSYGYTIKQPIEFELSAYGNILEDAGQNATAARHKAAACPTMEYLHSMPNPIRMLKSRPYS